MKLCLVDKVNFGFVNDSICCNEISDLSKLTIKQTHIISLTTFFLCFVFWFVFFYTVCLYFPGLFFLVLVFSPQISGNTLVSAPAADSWRVKCSPVLPALTDQVFSLDSSKVSLYFKSEMHGVEFTQFIVNLPIPAATMFTCC